MPIARALICALMAFPVALSAQDSIAPNASGTITASWTIRSVEHGPNATAYSEVWLVIQGREKKAFRMGEFVGEAGQVDPSSNPDALTSTILALYSGESHVADEFLVVPSKASLQLYHRALEEQGYSDFKLVRWFDVPPGTSFKTAPEVDLDAPALTRPLLLANPLLTGDDVDFLQFLLTIWGYREVGVVDGVFGQKTQRAVMRFQNANGLKVDGVAGEKTWTKLTEGGAVPGS